ncbi:winged helix-turn-helix transcriptional regulator [Microbacterium sp.]|uniref:winged helix-turn-helix transcriptional regulator n=1 Tax=Microbacterium sp. TaxID=51671 RepID=UPI003C70867E
MSTPLPGRPVRGSRSGRPLFALLDLMTRRWTMRIVWELQGRALSYVELQRACDGMSSSTLAARLRELVEAGVVERDGGGAYALTPLGADLPPAFDPLVAWSERWAQRHVADS